MVKELINLSQNFAVKFKSIEEKIQIHIIGTGKKI